MFTLFTSVIFTLPDWPQACIHNVKMESSFTLCCSNWADVDEGSASSGGTEDKQQQQQQQEEGEDGEKKEDDAQQREDEVITQQSSVKRPKNSSSTYISHLRRLGPGTHQFISKLSIRDQYQFHINLTNLIVEFPIFPLSLP